MRSNKNDDFFDDDFEVTYTEDLPPVSIDTDTLYEDIDEYDDEYEDEYEDGYAAGYRDACREQNRRPSSPRPQSSGERRPPKGAPSSPAGKRRSSSSSDLASPIRKPFQKGTRAVEQLSRFVLRPAPILCAAVITLITVVSFLTGHDAYGSISTLQAETNYTLLAYLTVGGILVLWEVLSFFFALSGLWSGRGRGLTFFILVYVCSYAASLAGGFLPDGIEIISGIKGGLSLFGSLYPMFFPFSAVGLITCIFKNMFE